MTLDHGELNTPLASRYGKGGIDAAIDRHIREQEKLQRAENKRIHAERVAARTAEAARPKLTAGDVRGASFVRDRFGWHKVVRVSAKSVTVATAYSWTDRIPLDRVLEVRRT